MHFLLYFLFILLHICDAITNERLKRNNNQSIRVSVKRAFQKGIAWPDATIKTRTMRLQRQLAKILQDFFDNLIYDMKILQKQVVKLRTKASAMRYPLLYWPTSNK